MTSRFAHRPRAALHSLGLPFALRALAVVLGLLLIEPRAALAQSTPPELVPIEADQVLTVPDDVDENNGFGNAAAVSGDTLAVGAPYDRDSADGIGAVYIFDKSDGNWSFAQKLVSNATECELFGYSLAIDDDILVVAAPCLGGANIVPGSAVVFVRDGGGTWTEQAQLEPSDAPIRTYFGSSVAISEQTVVVGAPADNELDESAGAAYVFSRSGVVWSEEGKLLALDGVAQDSLGYSVSVSDGVVLVGAHGKSFEDVERVGAAYSFERENAVWVQQQKMLPSDSSELTHFGRAVTVTGNVAVIGTDRNYFDTESDAVYVYARDAGVWADPGTIRPPTDRRIGYALASVSERLLIGGDDGVSLYAYDGLDWILQPLGDRGAPTMTQNDAVVATGNLTVLVYSIRRELGEPCNFGWMCESNTCVDNVCCNGACNGVCETCDATPGTCTSVVDAEDEGTCEGGYLCSAMGTCGLRDGEACAGDPANCASGYCADEVCCDTACDGGCDNCDWMNRGTCTTLAPGYSGEDPECAPFVCSGSASCPSNCTTDAQCASGYYCASGGECTQQKEQGSTCDDTNDCQAAGCRVCATGAGHCVNGVCCDTTCTGACSACDGADQGWSAAMNGTCSAAPSGFLGEPSCGEFVCDGSAPTCPGSDTACSDDDDCGPDHYCDGSQECQPRKDQGAACDVEQGENCLVEGCRVCQTGHCSDGFCCDQECTGGCSACTKSRGAEANGTCTVLADGSEGMGCGGFLCDGLNPACPETGSCLVDQDCNDDSYCTDAGSCAERKDKGETCSTSSECAPVDSQEVGYCVDGYCCDVACTNGCEACAASLKANGQDSGTCGPAQAGTDPHDSCAESPQNTCGETGACDGAGDCQLWPSNTSCGATFCTLENVTGQVCNGVGDCVTVTDLPCAPYLCRNNACTSPCEKSQECTTNHFCAAGVCVRGADAGAECTSGEECSSGYCIDGVCCNSECSGQCEMCAFPGRLGECVAVTGDPVAPRPACAGEPPCQGTCDGGDRTSCSYPDGATSCSEPSCEGDVLHPDARCDGDGKCAEASTRNCIPYGCDAEEGECRANCSVDAECAKGARCDEEAETCTSEGNQCKDAFTIESPSGEATSCAPYKCDAGACQQQCTRDSDCQQGYACDDSSCRELEGNDSTATRGSGGSAAGEPGDEPGAKSGSDGGCGCRASGSTSPGGGAWWLIAGGGIGLARRRRLVQHPFLRSRC